MTVLNLATPVISQSTAPKPFGIAAHYVADIGLSDDPRVVFYRRLRIVRCRRFQNAVGNGP